jgi:hypothetical protein
VTDANELLMGSGAKSCKFDNLGDTWVGTIVDQPTAKQMTKYQSTELDFWPSGDPKMQVVVPLQTDVRDPADPADNGRRVLFIPPRMMQPIRDAIILRGAKGLAIGGRLAVRWSSGTGHGEGNPKQYSAEYEPPQVDVGSLMGNGNGAQPAAPATPPQQQAPPAAAPPVATPASTAAGGMLTAPTAPPASEVGPPPGVDPGVWAGLPEAQRQAILAAMAPPAGAFTPQAPF